MRDELYYYWFEQCVENACKYPHGSFGYLVWWCLRYEMAQPENIKMWAEDPQRAMDHWYEYFAYKAGDCLTSI